MNLFKLLQTKEENRDSAWEDQFFKSFSEADVELLSQDPQQGPDGWPYLICQTTQKSKQSSSADEAVSINPIETTQKLFFWLADKGIGLVLNPYREPYPDFVFSYGMIWSFRETGYFIRKDLVAHNQNSNLVIENQKIMATNPPESYLPKYARKVLKDFFTDQGVIQPKILLITTDEKNFDLCFSLESLGNPPEKEHSGIAEAVSWFLPPHYNIVLISEKELPTFFEL